MFVRFCSNFHHTITIRQCTYGDKIGTEGSVLQELCHIVIPPDINGYIPDKSGYVKHEFRTNRIVTDSYRTSNGCLSPFCPVESFEHVQNFRTDGTDTTGYHRAGNGVTG